MTYLSKEVMEEIAERVAEFRRHEDCVQDACRKLSDAASVFSDAAFKNYCEQIGMIPSYVNPMRLIGDNESSVENEWTKVPSGALELCMLTIATDEEMLYVEKVNAAFAGGWKAVIPVLVELKRVRDPNYCREDGLPDLR